MGLVNKTVDTTGVTASLVCSVLFGTSKNNTIIMSVTGGGGSRVNSIADTQSNTWSIDTQTAATARTISLVRAKLTTALTTDDTITITMSAAQSVAATGLEFSGVWGVSPLDGNVSVLGSAVTSLASGNTAALTNSNQLVVTGCGWASAPGTITVPTGYTEVLPTGAGGLQDVAYKYITGTKAAQAATWAWVNAVNCADGVVTYLLSSSFGQPNNYQFIETGDGMSVTEKIR